MLPPRYKNLKLCSDRDGTPAIMFAGAVRRHRNPHLFKYYWWVFTEGCPVEGKAFLADRYRLTESEFEEVYRRCREQGIAALIYNAKHYRISYDTPWDKERLMSMGVERFAPGYDEDTDPVTSKGYR